ncbi:hypothetical protein JB92DRAFT_3006578 [Gautieria morchelliformis]|nr:hypothetical protein JB92DRAFT_3006578 [Gautieria morchelliformis]
MPLLGHRKPSVAVVGSGLAGLTAAYLLSSSGARTGLTFDVHIFEKAAALGMDAQSISVRADGHCERRIDVPMRSFQGGYYKQLIALYRHLGVNFRHANFSYSFSSLTPTVKGISDLRTYFIYNGSSGVKGVGFPTNNPYGLARDFANTLLSTFYFTLATILILFIYLRLLVLASPVFRPEPPVTFHQWVSQTTPTGIFARWTRLDAFWCEFSRAILLPMFSAVCTAPEEDVHAHPMAEFLEYIWVTLGSHHYVVKHGVRDVVSRLARYVPHIHLSCTVVSITTDPSDSSKISIQTSQGTYNGFSHLLIATQANNGIPLLTSYYSSLPKDASEHRQTLEELIQCLKSFQYRKTVVINHTDDTFLPPDQRDRRDLNLVQGTRLDSDEMHLDPLTVPMSYTMATHVLSNSKDAPIYQTTNPIVPPRHDSILSVAVLERAVLTAESKAALRLLSHREEGQWPFTKCSTSLGRLQGAGRLQVATRPGIWVCGSYAHSGIPLLEGCVASARDVVEQGILRCEGVTVHDKPW